MIMNETERKRKAVELMQQIGFDSEDIEDYSKNKTITLFGGGHIDYDLTVVACNKISEIEKKFDVTIYAMLYNDFYFGKCFTYLVVPKYEEDWKMLIKPTKQKDMLLVYAYVWNTTEEHCSEFGYVQVQVIDGMLQRIC